MADAARRIVIVSLNTSWESVYVAEGWRRGNVNRTQAGRAFPGGKGMNIFRFLAGRDLPMHVIAVVDRHLAPLVDAEVASAGGTADLVETAESSRATATIVDGRGRSTVFNGPGAPLSRDVVAGVRAALRASGLDRSLVVIPGSVPSGTDPGAITQMVRAASEGGAYTVVDTSGSHLRAAINARPDLVKVNSRELADALSIRFRISALPPLWVRGHAPEPGALAVTAGASGLRAFLSNHSVIDVIPPRLAPVSATASGDALTAGLLASLSRGRDLRDALIEGTAWAAENVRHVDAVVDRRALPNLREAVQVRLLRRSTSERATSR